MTSNGANRAALRELAPSGTIRVALNTANAALVVVSDRGLDGPAPQLIKALGEWAGMPVEVTRYASAGEVVKAAKDGDGWDVSFLAIDPTRAALFRFTDPYVTIEATAAVRSSSMVATVRDLDAPGVRIASSQGAVYDAILQRELRHATRMVFANPQASIEGFEAQGLEAVAGIRQTLDRAVVARPDLRVLPGRFSVIEHAMVVPASREQAGALLDEFLRDAAQATCAAD